MRESETERKTDGRTDGRTERQQRSIDSSARFPPPPPSSSRRPSRRPPGHWRRRHQSEIALNCGGRAGTRHTERYLQPDRLLLLLLFTRPGVLPCPRRRPMLRRLLHRRRLRDRKWQTAASDIVDCLLESLYNVKKKKMMMMAVVVGSTVT